MAGRMSPSPNLEDDLRNCRPCRTRQRVQITYGRPRRHYFLTLDDLRVTESWDMFGGEICHQEEVQNFAFNVHGGWVRIEAARIGLAQQRQEQFVERVRLMHRLSLLRLKLPREAKSKALDALKEYYQPRSQR
ncbi:hypothetical protein BGX29_003295 [Mortierella sp. GBA35]|nr:hypothetical protein BGX29_003295 [Mortierella sp. GBA35]